MKTPARLLFGVRTTGAVSLTITASGQLPSQVPALCIRTSEGGIAIPCSSNSWVAKLDAGDHVVHLPAPNDGSLDVPLTFMLSSPATIVAAAAPSSTALVSWTATTGTTASRDPKNPWPPPDTGSLDTVLMADSDWLLNTLRIDGAQIVERGD